MLQNRRRANVRWSAEADCKAAYGDGRPAAGIGAADAGNGHGPGTGRPVVGCEDRNSTGCDRITSCTEPPRTPHIRFGPMMIKRQPISVLLVFPKSSEQCSAFLEAACLCGHVCQEANSMEEAVQLYLAHHHSVVIVDTRPAASNSHGFDPEGLCSLFRATHNSEFTVIVAVTPDLSRDNKEISILPLLSAGFNRQFIENQSVMVCANELYCLEYGEVFAQSKLKITQALLVALEHSSEAVEITDDQHDIQYVNKMFERLTGFTSDELVGKNYTDLTCSAPSSDVTDDVTRVADAIDDQIKRGKSWDGIYHIRRKNGDRLCQKCRVVPVHGQSGTIRHYVSIRNPLEDTTIQRSDLQNGSVHRTSDDHTLSVPQTTSVRVRKESIVRLKSMSVETPISKVIYMLNSLRESSSSEDLADSVDKILDVLRSSELYHPNLSQQVRDDKTTSDLVGGLMTSMEEDSMSQRYRRVSTTKRPSAQLSRQNSACGSNALGILSHNTKHRDSTGSIQLVHNSTELETLLDSEARWDFDVISLERLTNKSPLVHLALCTLQRFEVCEYLMIEESCLLAWLHLMESNYHPQNPYHNSTHAADVMHATAYFLSCDRIKKSFDPIDEVASLLSAIIHDLDHPGKTNSFLVNAVSDVAILYNDLAVLESHHVSTAYQLTLKNENTNIFKNLTRDVYRSLRQQIVDMVLATEMTKHFEHLNRFVSVVDQDILQVDSSEDGCGTVTSGGQSLRAGEAKILIKRMLIKCADVSNPARPLLLCKEWALRIANEYCQQTDEEKARGLPVVMPVFDRKSCNVPKSQIGFIDLFINDMFAAWHNFCDLPDMMKCLTENYLYWKSQETAPILKICSDPS